MAAGIEIYNYVTNQKGSPALYSDVFANRPAAGFIGRLFVSTDTLEIYRDNGTSWDLIGSGGGPMVNIYNSDGTLTGNRIVSTAGNSLTFESGLSTCNIGLSGANKNLLFYTSGSPRWNFNVSGTESGNNSGSDYTLLNYDDFGSVISTPMIIRRSTGEKSWLASEFLTGGTEVITGSYNITTGNYQNNAYMTGGNPHGAEHNNFTLSHDGNLTFANSIYLGAQSNVLRLLGQSSGIINMLSSTPGIRTAGSQLNQIQYYIPSDGNITEITHAAGLQILGYYRLSPTGALQVNNAYGLLINDLNEYGYSTGYAGGALNLINRYGIYQDSQFDKNVFFGDTSIGTQTSLGEQLTIDGPVCFQNTFGGGAMPIFGINIYNNIAGGYFGNDIINISGPGTLWKINQYDPTIPSSAVVHIGGTSIGVNDTFDGYTIAQIVWALKDIGFLI